MREFEPVTYIHIALAGPVKVLSRLLSNMVHDT